MLGDPGSGGEPLEDAAVRRVLLCSGKVAYDLLAAREAEGTDDVAVVRVEQLYPLPAGELVQALERYPNAAEVVWVQGGAANMGAWQFMAVNLPAELPAGKTLSVVSRKASASPAVGSAKVHEAEQKDLVAAPSRSSRGAAVYFTDRGIEELVTRRARRRSPSPGWVTSCRPSSTSSPTSRCPSSGWPPGWPAAARATTTRTDRPASPLPGA